MKNKIDIKVDNILRNVSDPSYITGCRIDIQKVIFSNNINIICNIPSKSDKLTCTIIKSNTICFNYDDMIHIDSNNIRIRFALAHAFGHIALGHDVKNRVDTINNYTSCINRVEEDEANEFARKILVPRDLFDIAVLKSTNFKSLCSHFGVSEVLMKIRIDEITNT